MKRTFAPLSIAALLALTTGCPTQATPAKAEQGPPGPRVDEDDPRVVRDGDDLYPAENAPNPVPDGPAPGSGRPDTTNGVCKLFAPKLPEPECCPIETGFDAEQVKQLCGHQLYMGESLQQSCGYFYLPDMNGSSPVALRGSLVNETEVAAAAKTHDTRLARITKNPEFASTPVPGVEGALWSEADNLNWAFLPGWDKVRLISWTDDACPADKMPEVLALIAAAKPPPPNAPRELVPVARQ